MISVILITPVTKEILRRIIKEKRLTGSAIVEGGISNGERDRFLRAVEHEKAWKTGVIFDVISCIIDCSDVVE